VARKKKILTVIEIGRRGGLQRRKNLTPEQRSASATHANKVRWARYRAQKSLKVAS
jgi:hypothetical protein